MRVFQCGAMKCGRRLSLFALASTLVSVAFFFATVSSALASGKAFWYSSAAYNPIAADVSGIPDMNAMFEDDWNRWFLLTGSTCSGGPCVTGFTNPFAVPGQVASCNGIGCYTYYTHPMDCPPVGGICIYVYHQIYLSPDEAQAFFGALPVPTPTFLPIWARLEAGIQDQMQAARAIMTFIHEGYHNRFMSSDEGFVNACALRDFGYWLSKDFQIPETTVTTVMVDQQQTETKRVAYWVRVPVIHHRRMKDGKIKTWRTFKKVRRYKTVTTTTTVKVPTAVTVPNPVYQTLLADAQAGYQSQPAPYNTGTCTAPLPA
jgi:hypothetical protein